MHTHPTTNDSTDGGCRLARAIVAVAGMSALTTGALAAPLDCPFVSGVSVCTVSAGNSTLTMSAAFEDLVGFNWSINGVTHLAVQDFAIFDRNTGAETDETLLSAQFDSTTNEIIVAYQDPSVFNATGRFQLRSSGNTTTATETITFSSLSSAVLAARVYGYTDFNLNGSSIDDTAIMIGGSKLVQTDGGTTASVEVISGLAPNAFQVSVFDTLASTLAQPVVTLTLDNSVAGPGPANFEQAFSWDFDLAPGEQLSFTLDKTITVVPLPAAAPLLISGVLLLVGLRRRP